LQRTSEHVTIGVPVYFGRDFVAEALHSIRAQTHRDFDILISIDGPDPESEAVCRNFLDDSRFRLIVQPQRLGWRGNINWLMAQVKSDFWYFHGHDDMVDPVYLEVLLEHARRNPEAAVVYCDMRTFGTRDEGFIQPSIIGHPISRQLGLLFGHLAPVAFRGLVRGKVIRRVGHMRANEADDFLADTVWLASAARAGELHRVPMELYRKRYHDRNEHAKWWKYSGEQRIYAWTIHCRDMLREALMTSGTPRERRLIWAAGVGRLLTTRLGYTQIGRLDLPRQATILADFIGLVRKIPQMNVAHLLEADWAEIKRWTFDFYGLPRARLAREFRRVISRFSKIERRV
jgi:glycosyltransferase involved in cell wall biosynthesis